MSKSSHTMESFSRFVVAMICVIVGAGIIAFAFTKLDNGCAVGIPCHHAGDPVPQPHY